MLGALPGTRDLQINKGVLYLQVALKLVGGTEMEHDYNIVLST